MCSINGYVKFSNRRTPEVKNKIRDIIIAGEQRGKDSFGYVSFGKSGKPRIHKFVDKPSNVLPFDIDVKDDDILLLNNNRAEPTTEFIKDKKLTDVQPMKSTHCWAAHNGIIANDEELREKYGIVTDTTIDSSVIPYMFDNLKKYDYKEAIRILQDELIGSYAVSVYNQRTQTLYLATNYKPLTIAHDDSTDTLYFTSLESFINNTDDYNTVFEHVKYKEVKPYSLLVIHLDTKEIIPFDLYKDKQESKKKAVILASSGLDSTVCATWAKKVGYDVTLLHFNYQCRATEKETAHVKMIAEHLDLPLVTIKTDFIKNVIGGSRLTDETANIIQEDDKGAELAYEWVPARNLIFFSIAAGYAEAHGMDYLILGGNLEESGAYSDNELIFQNKFNDILPFSLNLQHRVEVLTPVADLMKKDIVKLGLEIDAPLHLTWSCYENGELGCGLCGPCHMRKTAFFINNTPEVVEYDDNTIPVKGDEEYRYDVRTMKKVKINK